MNICWLRSRLSVETHLFPICQVTGIGIKVVVEQEKCLYTGFIPPLNTDGYCGIVCPSVQSSVLNMDRGNLVVLVEIYIPIFVFIQLIIVPILGAHQLLPLNCWKSYLQDSIFKLVRMTGISLQLAHHQHMYVKTSCMYILPNPVLFTCLL